MFSETHRATLAAVLPGFLILGCSTWQPVAADPEAFDSLDREVRVETTDRGRFAMVATNVQDDELHGKDVMWTHTVEDSAAFHALTGWSVSPGVHEKSFSEVSIPFSSIVAIEARNPDAGKTTSVVVLVSVGVVMAGFIGLAIGLSGMNFGPAGNW